MARETNVAKNDKLKRKSRRNESSVQREKRLKNNKLRRERKKLKNKNNKKVSSLPLTKIKKRKLTQQSFENVQHDDVNVINFFKAAFAYDSQINYAENSKISIGKMMYICNFCNAYKFENETAGMCCASGKIKLPQLPAAQEPLSSYMSGISIFSCDLHVCHRYIYVHL